MSDQKPELARLTQKLNSTYHRWNIYELPTTTSVLDYLCAVNKNFKRETLLELHDLGCFYANGLRTKLTDTIPLPCKLEFYEPKHGRQALLGSYAQFNPTEHILYDQAGIVVLFKPARLHTMPAKEQNLVSLSKSLTTHFNCAVHIPSRLDFSTAGLVLVSRNKDTHDFVQKLYAQRKINKTYLFECSQTPTWQNYRCEARLDSNPTHPVLRKIVAAGGQAALTDFTFSTKLNNQQNLITAKPATGRTHQIRVHAASLGCALIGDEFYGGIPAEELHLVAYSLAFPTPDNNNKIEIKVPERLCPKWLRPYSEFLLS